MGSSGDWMREPGARLKTEDCGPRAPGANAGTVLRPQSPVLGRKDAGYTLVALAIGIAILTILVAAVGPSIATIMKREREEELIFRGRQYARAIALFQRRFQRFSNTLKELYDNRPRLGDTLRIGTVRIS